MLNLWEVITSRQRVFTEDLLQNTLYRKMRGESGGGGEYDVTITSTPPLYLPYSLGYNLADWSITGQTVQDGAPTPENPVDVQGVGDWDETTQKFKIPVVTRGTDGSETTTNIYLDSPLMTGETISSDGSREVEWAVMYAKNMNWTLVTGLNYTYQSAIANKDYSTDNFKSNKYLTTQQPYSNMPDFSVRGTATGNVVRVRDSRYSNVSDFVASLDDVYFVYKLATTTTSTITSPQIPTTTGTCVLDVDTEVQPSSMTVTYKSSVPDNDMADMIQLLSEI